MAQRVARTKLVVPRDEGEPLLDLELPLVVGDRQPPGFAEGAERRVVDPEMGLQRALGQVGATVEVVVGVLDAELLTPISPATETTEPRRGVALYESPRFFPREIRHARVARRSCNAALALCRSFARWFSLPNRIRLSVSRRNCTLAVRPLSGSAAAAPSRFGPIRPPARGGSRGLRRTVLARECPGGRVGSGRSGRRRRRSGCGRAGAARRWTHPSCSDREKTRFPAQASTGLIDEVSLRVIPPRHHGADAGGCAPVD